MFCNKKKVLLFGLQRSGTNYVRSILQKRFRVNFLNSNSSRRSPLHKHFRIYDQKDIIPESDYKNDIIVKDLEHFERLLVGIPGDYIVISKSPYSWLISYKKWAKECGWPEVQHHYIQEWNLFYKKWLELSRNINRVHFIRYVDLLVDLDNELNRVAQKVSLKKRFLAPFFNKQVKKVSQSDNFTQERKNYYIDEQYIDEFSSKELTGVNELIDESTLVNLGYKLHTV